MKRFLLIVLTVCAFLAVPHFANAQVVWDGAEIVKGQVGKLIFNKDVKIYKKNKDDSFTSLVVKKGQSYRVYSVNKESVGIVYGMSGGYRVQATNLVTYKAIPATLIQALGVPYTIKKIELNTPMLHDVRIAQVSGLLNKAAENGINLLLRQGINEAKADIKGIEEYPQYEDADYTHFYATKWIDRVLYNENNYFTVESTIFSGNTVVLDHAWVFNTYNLLTGEKVKISDFVNTPAKRKKLHELILKDFNRQAISADLREDFYYYQADKDYLSSYYLEDFSHNFYVKDNHLMFMFYIYAFQRDGEETRVHIKVPISAIQAVK